MERKLLDRAAQFPNGDEEEELEELVFQTCNFGTVEEARDVLKQLWYAFVRREHLYNGCYNVKDN